MPGTFKIKPETLNPDRHTTSPASSTALQTLTAPEWDAQRQYGLEQKGGVL